MNDIEFFWLCYPFPKTGIQEEAQAHAPNNAVEQMSEAPLKDQPKEKPKTVINGKPRFGLLEALDVLKAARVANGERADTRVFLEVPFRVKDKAKRLGAVWSAHDKKWFVPNYSGLTPFVEWFPDQKLLLDLVPANQWGKSLAKAASRSDWDSLRRACYARASHQCEICGGKGPTHPVECHEVWEYQKARKLQKLVRLIALCPDCHKVKHWGRSTAEGENMEYLIEHMMTVNDWTKPMVKAAVDDAFRLWFERNKIDWSVDVSLVRNLLRHSNNAETLLVEIEQTKIPELRIWRDISKA